MKSPVFPFNEKENPHLPDALRKKEKKISEFASDTSFSSDLSSKFLKSLIKKKSMPLYSTQSTQTEAFSLENIKEMLEKELKMQELLKIYESDIDKLRFENLKLEKALKSLQETLASRGQNQNNTSSGFSLPSEFKNTWDLLIKDLLSSLFCNFLENPLIYVNLIQDLLKLIEDFVEAQIKTKTLLLCEKLNLKEKQDSVYKNLINLYQDYHSLIFQLTPVEIALITADFKTKALEILNFPYNSFERNCDTSEIIHEIPKIVNGESEIVVLLENPDFARLITLYHSLSLYMKLNEPPLKTSLEDFKKRAFCYVLFRKSEFYCIDGFVKENGGAIIVVPAVKRGNFIYNGMKPAVLMLGKEIMAKEGVKKIIEGLKNEKNEGNCKENRENSHENRENSHENRENIKENIEKIKENMEKIKENMENNKENKDDIKEDNTEVIRKNKEDYKDNMKENEEFNRNQEVINENHENVKENKENIKETNENIKENTENIKEIIENIKETSENFKETKEIDVKTLENRRQIKQNPIENVEKSVGNGIKMKKFDELSSKLSRSFKAKTFNHISYTERGDYHKNQEKICEKSQLDREISPKSSRTNLRNSPFKANLEKTAFMKHSHQKKWSPIEFKTAISSINNTNKNLLKEVLELKNHRTNLETFKQNFTKNSFRDSFDQPPTLQKPIKSKKKHIISDPSDSSSSFSENFSYLCEKNAKANKFHSITHISSIKPAKNPSHDLPRDKESFNKRKSMNEMKKNPSDERKLKHSNENNENIQYYFGQNRRKTDNKGRLEVFLKEDLKNTIISLKNSIEMSRNQENMTLKQKWKEAQEKSLEKAGKIVNQAKKLKTTAEISQFIEENGEKNKKKMNNYIDEIKPGLLRKKPNNSFISSGSVSFNNNTNAGLGINNNNHKSLAEKLKKEILSMNEIENTACYNLTSNNNNNKKKEFINNQNNNDSKEKRSVSMRRTLNCLLETMSSEEEENKAHHLQRKSLNPAGSLEKKEGNNVCAKNTNKNFERKDIEKIYKEYKSRKI